MVPVNKREMFCLKIGEDASKENEQDKTMVTEI